MYKQWKRIADKGLIVKPTNKFAHDCACCEYVLQRELGVGWRENWDEQHDPYLGLTCLTKCPMKELWPNGCECDDSPYELWEARKIADFAKSKINKAGQ
ncbi:MAG: hypothetical protein KAS32_30930 [Candidatus Peribacteraceae bacterium]|nr:hypothetical protein [Candidatus Peribacteraceae bacterium]